MQLSTATDLFEPSSLHGRTAAGLGDWSIEVIGRAMRQVGCGMKMAQLDSMLDVYNLLDTNVGMILGNGAHWTAVIKRSGRIIFLDSNVGAFMPVAKVISNANKFVGKSVFLISEGGVEDEFRTDSDKFKQAAAVQRDWSRDAIVHLDDDEGDSQ